MGALRAWISLGLLIPPLLVREGSLVVVATGASAPERCQGQRGVVTLVNKFGSCMVYFSELREAYFFSPGDLIIDKEN